MEENKNTLEKYEFINFVKKICVFFKTIISHRYKVNDFCDSPVKIGREIFLLFYKEEDFRFKTTITGLASSVRLRRAGIAASCSGWIK